MGAYELAIAELTEEAGEEARERWTDWARRLRRNKRISDILQVGLQPCEEKNLTRARVYNTVVMLHQSSGNALALRT